MISIIDREIFFIPTNLAHPTAATAVFKNQIEKFYVDKSQISSIKKADLEQFGTILTHFGVTNSKLQFITKDIFEVNTGLKMIDLQGNDIAYIETGAFTKSAAYLTAFIELRLVGICGVTEIALAANLASLVTSITSNCGDGKKLDFFNAVVNNFNKCSFEKKNFAEKIEKLDNQIDALNPTNDPCRFKENVEGYACIGNKIFINSTVNQKIEWKGNHTEGKFNADVKALIIKSQTVKFMPLEVGKFFPNLTSLIIENSTLSVLKNGDFKFLENLIKISLANNEILTIESSTFSELKLLVHLDLSFNRLMQLRSDYLPSPVANNFEFSIANNRLSSVDIVFVWRLKNAKSIDLSGNNRCNYKFITGDTFSSFFSLIIGNC